MGLLQSTKVDLGFLKYVEPTPASLEEVRTLAMVISRAYQMYVTRRTQRDNTKRTMTLREKALKTRRWWRLALPHLFVAYSGVARLAGEARAEHDAVIETIWEVVGELTGIVKAVYSEEITETGNINNQVSRNIGSDGVNTNNLVLLLLGVSSTRRIRSVASAPSQETYGAIRNNQAECRGRWRVQ